MTGLHTEAERTNGAGDQDFARSGFAGFASDLYAAGIEALHCVGEAERSELEAVRAEGIGLNNLRASFDVSLVDAENGFGLGGVEFIEAALRADSFVKHRAHCAIRDEDRVFQPFIEVKNLQRCSALLLWIASRGKALNVSVP